VPAVIGRTFIESEDRSDGNAVMLTWNLFVRRFGGDPSIAGKQIHLDGKPYTVVGVLPKWFTYPEAKAELWVPYASGLPPAVLAHHDFHYSRVVAGVRRIVRSPLLPDDAAHWRDRRSHGAGCTTRAGFAPDAGRWPAARGLWAGAWPCGQRRSGTANPVDALWNPATRSGDLCGCGCNVAGGGGAGLPGSGVESVADRSYAGLANGVRQRPWICPSPSTHAKVGCRLPICHPDRSAAEWRDLRFHSRAHHLPEI